MRYFILLLLVSGFFQSSFSFGSVKTNDSDLSGTPSLGVLTVQSRELTADETSSAPIDKGMAIEVLRLDHGQRTPVTDLTFEVRDPQRGTLSLKTNSSGVAFFESCSNNQEELNAKALLQTNYFNIQNRSQTYQISIDILCQTKLTLIFHEDTTGGQALGIWQTAMTAQNKLRESVGLDFWSSQIQINWPSDGDYYGWGSVNLTQGHHWDVVGHELGHAIYDLANVGSFGGGQHRIDECYSAALALSEGWASFFAAWLRVSLDDSDAKFEYLVPRRAPIRFENVPEDVCRSERNEWRVTAFYWDIIDLNNDNESMEKSFDSFWNALLNANVRSTRDSYSRLIQAGFNSSLLDLLWELNF